MFFSTPEILANEMDISIEFLKNNYLDWMTKEPEIKPQTSIINLDGSTEIYISVYYVPSLSEEFRNIFDILVHRSSSKEPTPLNVSLCSLKN